MNIFNIYMDFWIFSIIVCSIIFFYLVYDNEFKKFDPLTDTWYFGSKENHHKKLFKKNPHMWKRKFYYLYGDTKWYNSVK